MAKQIEYLVTAPGFYAGARLAKGEKFRAPEGFKAKWATPADGITIDDVDEIENPIATYLAQNARTVIAGLEGKPVAELRQLVDAETASASPRTSVLAKLQDAIATAEQNPADDKDDELLS